MDAENLTINFDILLDESFLKINLDTTLNPVENKNILSIVNDFEDKIWRYDKFQKFIWDNIAETALSLRERNALINKHHSSLVESAKNLRLIDKENGEGSELAEILLYGIMKYHFKALAVVPKIFYKQNTQDFAKGSDSVHIVVANGDFTLWFGEAKFYNSIEDARFDVIIKSVENSLKTDKLKKENSIITNVSDLDYLVISDELRNKIKELLTPSESIDKLKPKLNIPILILHECEITQKFNELTEDYKNEIIQFHKEKARTYFKKQIVKISTIPKYAEIMFHIILFPVPSKETIVKNFIDNVKHYKKQ